MDTKFKTKAFALYDKLYGLKNSDELYRELLFATEDGEDYWSILIRKPSHLILNREKETFNLFLIEYRNDKYSCYTSIEDRESAVIKTFASATACYNYIDKVWTKFRAERVLAFNTALFKDEGEDEAFANFKNWLKGE